MNSINHLLTELGEKTRGLEYSSYPRPSLVRDSFISLNGEWSFSCEDYCGTINVPFCPESLLSGVCRVFSDGAPMNYKKNFVVHNGFIKDRVILHFGAVDGICSVSLNGHLLGTHAGGYDNFSFDITDYLNHENELSVEVVDKLGGYVYPYGKQSLRRGGMWYTPVSGIWQAVWLESVPKDYIKSIKTDTGLKVCKIFFDGAGSGELCVKTPDGEKLFPIVNGVSTVKIDNPINWTPENPYLYYYTARCGHDEVKSYFALRTVGENVVNGVSRLCLNGEPYFFNGVLDQGYFSDGIYTPASPEEYKNDILAMKRLGFNTLRKHIKVEPQEFYYQCDVLGMVVFQDMVNNGKYSFFHDTALPTIGFKNLPEKKRTEKQKEAFIEGMRRTVDQLYNHPSICYYTIFNEGWGQFDSDKLYPLLKELDSSRIIDTNSGWFGKHTSDVESLHVYFKKVKIKKSELPVVLSEFGGYSYKIPENSANLKNTYGYRLFDKQEEFEKAVIDLYENEVIPNIEKGLCVAIYTQLSDVEDETNGFLTYDRRILKVDEKRIFDLMQKLKIN